MQMKSDNSCVCAWQHVDHHQQAPIEGLQAMQLAWASMRTDQIAHSYSSSCSSSQLMSSCAPRLQSSSCCIEAEPPAPLLADPEGLSRGAAGVKMWREYPAQLHALIKNRMSACSRSGCDYKDSFYSWQCWWSHCLRTGWCMFSWPLHMYKMLIFTPWRRQTLSSLSMTLKSSLCASA